MPEQAYTPPETKYEVHIDELMKAIRGEDFVQGNGLWRMREEEITGKKISGETYVQSNNDQVYVILIEAKLIGGDIILQNSELRDYGIGFIFFKSFLPTFFLIKGKIESFYFYNSLVGSIYIDDNSQVGNIRLDSNSKSGNITISNNSLSQDISIGSNSQSDILNINSGSQSGNILIFENSLTNGIHIVQNSRSERIRIHGNSQIGGIVIFSNCECGKINIEDNKEPFDLEVHDESYTGDLFTRNAKLGMVKIENNFFGIDMRNTSLQRMTLSRCLLSKMHWAVGTKGEIYITNDSYLMHLNITANNLPKDSVLALSNTKVFYFTLEEIQIQGSLLLRKVEAASRSIPWPDIVAYLGPRPNGEEYIIQKWDERKIFLEKKQEYYQRKFSKVNLLAYGPTPIFRITHSSLGKTEITGCDFSGFQFQYYNSNLLGCFITGTKLPKRNMVIYDTETGTVLDNNANNQDLFEQKTAVYNQFKKIYENQGDVVEASIFHAQAMHWEQKLLWRQFRHDKEGFWKKVKLFFENIGFRLNWFSNNHGESWLVALVFTIGVGLLFFTASIWGLTHWGDGKTWYDNIHKLPGFMLPTHSYDYLSKDIIETTKATYPHLKVNLWHTLWDFMGRIFVGYGIFQFISAFRRHGKKGG